jgi:N-acetyl-anhydromuramyl-L-alanine amidase AmpD
MKIIHKIISNNYKKGRGRYKPEAIVIHMAQGTMEGMHSWFNNPASGVSAHYGIGKDGEIHKYVGELNTAWHAGSIAQPRWKKIKENVNPNLYTIGIELAGKYPDKMPTKQKAAVQWLVADICTRWGWIPEWDKTVTSHAYIDGVNRKNDPGPGVSVKRDIADPARMLMEKNKIGPKEEKIKELEKEVETTYESYLKEKELKDGYKQDVKRLKGEIQTLKARDADYFTRDICKPRIKDKVNIFTLFIKKIFNGIFKKKVRK